MVKEPPPPPTVHLRGFYAALKGKTVPTIKMVDWVLNNLHREISTIEQHEPPSFGALVMLKWASDNPDSFFCDFVAKLLPTKSQLEVDERQKDDGRLLTVLEGLQQEFNAKAAKTPGAEPGVEAEAAGIGEHEQDGA